MAHNPVNHPARPVYRAIGGLTGIYLVIFGVLGVLQTGDGELFAQDDKLVLGQGVNLAGSALSIALGAIVLIGVLIGRNVDVAINKWFGYLFQAIGLGSLALLRTDANYLDYSLATCVVMMLLGLVLLMAGMYGKVGTDEEAKAWRDARLVL
ncbi:DUF4383 domain-containing protein [Micromonospora sp. NPDC049559]|uniref:DUF4383 domain-containing protein n=1 Tax=Micromonospora sp. NPDC049559 TaxID=3155923 RepID=UPI00344A9043